MTPDLPNILRLLAQQHPGFEIRSLELVGEGLDNFAVEINGAIITRFAKTSGAQDMAREVRVLETLGRAGLRGVPVPIPQLRGENYFSYRKIPGQPLLFVLEEGKPKELSALCHSLGELLSKLHGIPLSVVEDLVPVELVPLASWLDEARATFGRVKDLVPEQVRGPIEDFLMSPPPGEPSIRTLIHNDLGIEHLIVHWGNLTSFGVLDWSDCAIGDPLVDFCRIYRDLGAERLQEVFLGYGLPSEPSGETLRRVQFYARCGVFEELEYGRELGHEVYLRRAIGALQTLFPS